MRRIIVSLFIIAAMTVTTIGATRAYFSSQDTITGNTLGAGKLKVILRADSGSTVPINIANMAPGIWSSLTNIGVENPNTPDSTMPLKYRFYDQKTSESVGGFYDKIWVRVRHTWAGTPGTWPIVWEGKLKDLYIDSPTYSITAPTGGLNVWNTHVYQLEFKLDEGASNTYQGQSATFDLVVYATQVNNPGW